ncbi:hypothetical protein AGIG_G4629 [Arapaima gigas]
MRSEAIAVIRGWAAVPYGGDSLGTSARYQMWERERRQHTLKSPSMLLQDPASDWLKIFTFHSKDPGTSRQGTCRGLITKDDCASGGDSIYAPVGSSCEKQAS